MVELRVLAVHEQLKCKFTNWSLMYKLCSRIAKNRWSKMSLYVETRTFQIWHIDAWVKMSL